jgi:voltage-dependent potassium channel beta subunit
MSSSQSQPQVEYDPKNMIFRRLGSSGLRVPVFSMGAWLSFGKTVHGDTTKDILKLAFENGINMIDCAEVYAHGQSEREVGRVIKELGWRRTDLIITTKIFFGVGRKGPNDNGLSRKHIIEGLNESLERLGLDYVDIVFAHRPDNTVPMHEVVRAFNHLIDQGKAFYWATSEWSARQIEEAHHVATDLKLIPPIAEQCKYHALDRQRFEEEYKPLYQKYGYGTTVFSALAAGFLTGKYNNGIPEGSRFVHSPEYFGDLISSLDKPEGKALIEKVKKLTEYAEKEFGCSVSALALAWAAKNPNTSTVILGATKPEQLLENLKALEILPKLTDEKWAKVNEILENHPKPVEPLNMGR